MSKRLTKLLAAVVLTTVVFGTAAHADLVSHRALYEMSLLSARHGSDIVALRGKMALEVVDTCDGWTLDQRIALTIYDPRGSELNSYISFASWESKDGSRFSFRQQTRFGDHLVEESSGRAELDAATGGTAYYTKPEKIEIALPPGTVFPMRHTDRVIEGALAGESHVVVVVFDGSSLDNPSRVSAFIGPLSEMDGLAEGDGPRATWPIHLAFFPMTKASPLPEVEIGMLMQDDGVARSVDLDYGDFAIHGELTEFEVIAPKDC
jgi:hypothetical protein